MYVNKVRTEDEPAGTRCIKFIYYGGKVRTYLCTKYPDEKCDDLRIKEGLRLDHSCEEFLQLPEINDKMASRFFRLYERDVGKVYGTDETPDKDAPYHTRLVERVQALECC